MTPLLLPIVPAQAGATLLTSSTAPAQAEQSSATSSVEAEALESASTSFTVLQPARISGAIDAKPLQAAILATLAVLKAATELPLDDDSAMLALGWTSMDCRAGDASSSAGDAEGGSSGAGLFTRISADGKTNFQLENRCERPASRAGSASRCPSPSGNIRSRSTKRNRTDKSINGSGSGKNASGHYSASISRTTRSTSTRISDLKIFMADPRATRSRTARRSESTSTTTTTIRSVSSWPDTDLTSVASDGEDSDTDDSGEDEAPCKRMKK